MPVWNDCAVTHTGNVRANNEDAFCCLPAQGLWVVADGMGGHEAGEVASAITIDTVARKVRQGKTLAEALQSAHESILSATRKGQGARGMGSTVVALHSNGEEYEIAWVGDSRAYLWTRTGERHGTLEQLTVDHSYVQMLVQSGVITAAEAERHPERNVITQCLGSLELADVKVDTLTRPWQPDQWILLCSDGLTDELDDSQISAILAGNADIQSAAEALLRAALASGGRDNTTIALIGKEDAAAKNTLWHTLKQRLRMPG
jgi:serine/threonine protein phosphatase PrpC